MAVQGLPELLRKLRRVPGLAIEEVRKAMEKAATDMVRQMQAVAPRDEGTLAASIGWTWGDAPQGSMSVGRVQAGGSAGRAFNDLVITVYAGGNSATGDAFYARFQEFGTKNMPANPFFFPVYRANRARTKAAISRGIRKALKNA
jgi:HK97 gp10 family phage protein